MKKLLSGFFILIIVFPMLFYLNPFLWGMRRMPVYRPSSKTQKLFSELDNKYDTEVHIDEVIDTLWYFRDLKTGKRTEKENFKLRFSSLRINDSTNVLAGKYTADFASSFEHRKYFDSIIVRDTNDSIIVKMNLP